MHCDPPPRHSDLIARLPGDPIDGRVPSRSWAARFLLAGLLGVAGPVLASCGSSGAGLIPAQNAGPLQGDFDEVAQAAERGNGNCIATEEKILKMERDFAALPGSVDAGLRKRIREGVSKLSEDALGICKQPLAPTTATNTTPKTTTTTGTTSTPTVTQPTTTSTQTTPTTTPTSGTGGGTPAPSEGPSGGGSEQGGGAGSGGASAGGGGAAGGAGPGGAQEGGK